MPTVATSPADLLTLLSGSARLDGGPDHLLCIRAKLEHDNSYRRTSSDEQLAEPVGRSLVVFQPRGRIENYRNQAFT